MSDPAATILFDVNGTLSDLRGVAEAFEQIGAPRQLAATWFTSILQDGFALTVEGGSAPFPAIAEDVARDLLAGAGLDGVLDQAVETVLGAFAAAPPHPDVADGLRSLHRAGHRLVTLSNGPTSSAERLLAGAGVLDLMDALLSVEEHTPWKPSRAAYEDALTRLGAPERSVLAAVHPWDLHGAAGAGLATAWINRTGRRYPGHFRPPVVTVDGIGALVPHLEEGGELARHLEQRGALASDL